jgi:FtsP/CotA-like multicopper oxidase with cupredoxin domain
MHSHITVQETRLIAAPLIVRRPEDLIADRQEVVVLLHDFSCHPAEAVLGMTTGGAADHDMAAMGASIGDVGGTAAMDHSRMSMPGNKTLKAGYASMGGTAKHLNNLDSYLANDRTLADPDVIMVDPGGRVRLCVVNTAAATSFWIDAGDAPAQPVAEDGHPVVPVSLDAGEAARWMLHCHHVPNLVTGMMIEFAVTA